MKRLILSSLIGLMTTFGAYATDSDQERFSECLNGMNNDQGFVDYLNKGNALGTNNSYSLAFSKSLNFKGLNELIRKSAQNYSKLPPADQLTALRQTTNIETPMAWATLRYVVKNCPEYIAAITNIGIDEAVFYALGLDNEGYIEFKTYDNWEKSTDKNEKIAYTMKADQLGKVIPGLFFYVVTPKGQKSVGDWLTYEESNSYGNSWSSKCSDNWTYYNVNSNNELSKVIRDEFGDDAKNKRTANYFFDLGGRASNTLIFPGMLIEDKLNSTTEEVVRNDKLFFAIDFAKRLAVGLANTTCATEGTTLQLNVVAPYDFQETLTDFSNSGWNPNAGTLVATGTAAVGGITAGILLRRILKNTGPSTGVLGAVKRFAWPITVALTSWSISEAIYKTYGEDMRAEIDKVFILAQFDLNTAALSQSFVENNLKPVTELSKALEEQNNEVSLEYTDRDDYSTPAQQPAKKKQRTDIIW